MTASWMIDNLARAHCHNDNWGRKLAGIACPKATPRAIRSIAWVGRRRARCSACCDLDPLKAAATRRRFYDMAATERMPIR